MELKKTFLIIIFLLYNNLLNANMIKPNQDLSPYDIVKIQLNALKNNNLYSKDSGIKQVWIFAHPENKKTTGPFERFKKMIYGEQYELLIQHNSHKIKLIMNSPAKHIFGVEILNKNKELFFYEWHVEKGSDENCKNCWFTSAVSIPINQGNTI